MIKKYLAVLSSFFGFLFRQVSTGSQKKYKIHFGEDREPLEVHLGKPKTIRNVRIPGATTYRWKPGKGIVIRATQPVNQGKFHCGEAFRGHITLEGESFGSRDIIPV